jgi:hypothetical protein
MISAGEDLPDSDRGGWTCNSQQAEDFTDCYNAGKHYVVGPTKKESRLLMLPTQRSR